MQVWLMTDDSSGVPVAVRSFLERYRAGWSDPSSGAIAGIWAADARMTHPELDSPVLGRDGVMRYLEDVLSVAPDLAVEPLDAAWAPPVLFVRFRARGTFNGKSVEWEGVDRFELEGDVAVRGDGYFDTAPLRRALEVAPS